MTSTFLLATHVWTAPVGTRVRPVGWLRVAACVDGELPKGRLGDGPGVNRLALPVADLAFHPLLGPRDLRHDESRSQQPGGDKARHETGQGEQADHDACPRGPGEDCAGPARRAVVQAFPQTEHHLVRASSRWNCPHEKQ